MIIALIKAGKRTCCLSCFFDAYYKGAMLKVVCKQEGRTSVDAIAHENRIDVGFHLGADATFCPNPAQSPMSKSAMTLIAYIRRGEPVPETGTNLFPKASKAAQNAPSLCLQI